MSIKELIVTPEIARDLLNKNTNNRKLSSSRVATLVMAMQRGEWQYNGDTIRISKSGRLLDGQHRLSAIEQSGISQKYVIVDELDDDVFTTIDTGSARNASQMLGMVGAKNATSLAAAARMHLMLKAHGTPIHGTPEKQVTHTQVVDFADGNEILAKSAAFGTKKWLNRYVGPSITALCHYEFGLIDEATRDSFFNELMTGEFSYGNSPIKFIRELFIEERGSTYSFDRKKRIALIFRAFNMYRVGKESKIVRLTKNQEDWYKL